MDVWTYEDGTEDLPAFRDRVEAGSMLAHHLARLSGPDTVVLGIPRGGVVVAAEVARRLHATLDLFAARKLGAPVSAELAIGAVTADGTLFIDRPIVRQLEVSEVYLRTAMQLEQEKARLQEMTLRGDRPAVPVGFRTVVVVDDGLATGATMRAAVRALRRRRPARIVVAVPVGARQACEALRREADEVVCPFELRDFGAVGWYYVDFAPTTDAEVRELLERAHAVDASAEPAAAQ